MRRFVMLCLVLSTFVARAAAATPAAGHVVVVALENTEYSAVVGSANMPYLNSLIRQGGLATNFYATAPGSLPDYFMLTVGQTITPHAWWNGTVTADNLAREINRAGKTWKVYAESLPYTGYVGGTTYPYMKWHNPFAYFSDVLNSAAQRNRIVAFSRFSNDLAGGALPNFSFVVPNQEHNAHDCPSGGTNCTQALRLRTADAWLKYHIAPLVANAEFMRDGLLVIWFDEGTTTANGGGHVATVLVGPEIVPGSRTGGFYKHQHLLRTICEALRLPACPGAAASVGPITGIFLTKLAQAAGAADAAAAFEAELWRFGPVGGL